MCEEINLLLRKYIKEIKPRPALVMSCRLLNLAYTVYADGSGSGIFFSKTITKCRGCFLLSGK